MCSRIVELVSHFLLRNMGFESKKEPFKVIYSNCALPVLQIINLKHSSQWLRWGDPHPDLKPLLHGVYLPLLLQLWISANRTTAGVQRSPSAPRRARRSPAAVRKATRGMATAARRLTPVQTASMAGVTSMPPAR